LAACGVKEPIQKRCSTKDKQCCSEPFSHVHQRTPMSCRDGRSGCLQSLSTPSRGPADKSCPSLAQPNRSEVLGKLPTL
jgi:hypothetical protein